MSPFERNVFADASGFVGRGVINPHCCSQRSVLGSSAKFKSLTRDAPAFVSTCSSTTVGSGPARLPWHYFPSVRSAIPGQIQSSSTRRCAQATGECGDALTKQSGAAMTQFNDMTQFNEQQDNDQPASEQTANLEPIGNAAAEFATKQSGKAWHLPVLVERIEQLLAPALAAPGAVYVDLTLGMAGHASRMLRANPNARLVGIDQDREALQIAAQQLRRVGIADDRVHLVHARFDELGDVLDELGIAQVHAVLADLGLSSLQIDKAERGFAYATHAPLDMRMNADAELTAEQIVNAWPVHELVDIFRRFGEEPNAKRIAAAIEKRRVSQPFTDSADLVDVITEALPAAVRHAPGGGHPAKRVFQALRIAVNGELDALADMLPVALNRLAVGGRMSVISYHSLEDRLVKQTFTQATRDDVPRDLPFVPDDRLARFVGVTRGAEQPSSTETTANPRARSAKLRVIERVREGDVHFTSRQGDSR